MSPVTFSNSSTVQENQAPAYAPKVTPNASSVDADQVHLSPAAQAQAALTGRVAMNTEAGNLTSDQSQQLYTQIGTIHSQIAMDRQADGGTLSTTDAAAIQQAQSQLSQTVYSDAHNGATAPTNPTTSEASRRETMEAGRIALNEKAGNLGSTQSQVLGSQLSSIHQQITTDQSTDGGTLNATDAKAINALESQLSQQINTTSHDGAKSDQGA